MRIGLITLGCDKNTVDNEYLAGMLEGHGCDVMFMDDPSDGDSLDAVVVTTCGFIGDAKQQSVDTIFELTERKREAGNPRRVFVAGCLAQRYADEILKEMPEIDGLVGVGQYGQLTQMLLDGSPAVRGAVNPIPDVNIEQFMRRKRVENTPHAFLKISDGCNHGCAFCSIPLMKGRHRSVPVDILLQEARSLLDQGARELVLVAQDLAHYGKDWGHGYRLPQLLRELCGLDGDFWVRCMYCYPAGVTDEFLEVLATEPKMVPYLDVPLQHLDPDMLRRMNRPSKDVNTTQLVKRLRDAVPHIAIRTTMIVGFPGESRQAHLNMLSSMRELEFNWLGAFRYSPEEGTPAGTMDGQLSRATKERRWKSVMETQMDITERYSQSRVGSTVRVLIEGFDRERGMWFGRTPHEAPEVDGTIYMQSDRNLDSGTFVNATIVSADVYDLRAAIEAEQGLLSAC